MNAEIDLLGGLPSVVDGRPIPATEWRRRQAASLVKLLALAPRRTLHRKVMDALWPGAVIARGCIMRRTLPVVCWATQARSTLRDRGHDSMNSRLNAGNDPNRLAEPPPVQH